MKLVVQPPVGADDTVHVEAMLVNILRQRVDFWRPSWIVMQTRSKMRQIYRSIMAVYEKNTHRRRAENDSGKWPKVFARDLGIKRFREEGEG